MAGGINNKTVITPYRSPLYDVARDPRYRAAQLRTGKGDLPPDVAARANLSPLQTAAAPTSLSREVRDEAAAAQPVGVQVVQPLAAPEQAPAEANYYTGFSEQLGPVVRDALTGLPRALASTRDAELRRLGGERGIYGDELATLSKPGRDDTWLQFGIGMLQPTTTGSFAEGMGAGFDRAAKARQEYRREEQARQEKLFAARRGLNNLTGGAERAQLDYADDALKLPGVAMTTGGELADLELLGSPMPRQQAQIGNGLTPTSGPEAILRDYQINPAKYSGQRGQAMVQQAYDRAVKAQEAAAPAKQNATTQKAILEADELAMNAEASRNALRSILMPSPDYGGKSINETAYSGTFAPYGPGLARLDMSGYLLDDNRARATTELENRVLNQALSSLKATFGAAPTEGERKILVDLQASVEKTPAEREAIIRNAMSMLRLREQFNRQKAAAIRDGSYFGQDGAPTLVMPEVYPVPDDLSLLEDGGYYQLDDGSIGQFDAAAGGFNTVED